MSKTKRFDVESNEPSGATFAGNRTHIKDMADRTSQKKPKANFGIEHGDPNGTTFVMNKSHIDIPGADKAPLISKAIYTSGGQGEYNPPESQITSGTSYAGRPGIGKSSPKSGQRDKIAQKFKV